MSKYWTDVMIHIDEDLALEDIKNLQQSVAMQEGIYSACVNDKRRHLMLVDFDPMTLNTGEILKCVERHGVHAELVGL